MSQSQPPILYFDGMSQPSRACLIFCRLNRMDVVEQRTEIHKGTTRAPEYLAVNPLGKVPFLQHGSLMLPESGAILTYLAQINGTESWLPSSPQEQAPIIAAMHWFHNNLRAGCVQLIFNVGAIPLGQQPNQAAAEKGLDLLKASLASVEGYWLRGSKFLAGRQTPSIADLQYCTELEQLVLCNKERHGTSAEELLEPFPLIRRWMVATASACAPHYEEVHAIVRKVAALKGGSRSPTMRTQSAKL